MGLKLLIGIFLILVAVANAIVFLFIRGVNVIDHFKVAVLGFLATYFPIGDPLLVLMLLSFAVIIAVAIILLKIGSRGSA